MKICITGVNGFVGVWLARQALAYGHEVIGLDLSSDSKTPGIQYFCCNLTDRNSVDQCFEKVAPDAVFHLAALAFLKDSEDNLQHSLDVNVKATLNLMDACLKYAAKARFIYISSSEVYGVQLNELTCLSEDSSLSPENPYAITKLTSEYYCRFYRKQFDLDAVILRPFNHTGPGQCPRFVCSDFARQIALIEMGAAEPVLRVGNLLNEKDFSDVRDITRGYMSVLAEKEACAYPVYNIGSGVSHSIAEILEILLSFSSKQIQVEIDPAKYRKDIYRCYGDISRLKNEFNWKTEFDLTLTLKDILSDWRVAVSQIEKKTI